MKMTLMSRVQFRTAVAKAYAEKRPPQPRLSPWPRHAPLKDALTKYLCRAVVSIMVQITETSSSRINKEREVTAPHCHHTYISSSNGSRHLTYCLTCSLPQPIHSPN